MKKLWLKKENNSSLIVFFNGWAMDELPFSKIIPSDFDFIMLYDYTNFYRFINNKEFFVNDLKLYDKIFVIAWSYGVWVCSHFFDIFPEKTRFIAVNGTLKPIDQRYGIHIDIFNATLINFSDTVRKKFYYNMFSSKKDFVQFLKIQPERCIKDQKKELEYLKEKITRQKEILTPCFHKVFIGKNDKVIFTKNQLNYWKTKNTEIKLQIFSHFPFYEYNIWEKLIV